MERKFPKLEPLPKEETPAPLIIPKREKPVEKPEETTEKPEETPAVETSAEKITEPVAETSPAEEKASAEARAEALIMAHTAKTKPKTKSKGPLAVLCVLASLAIAAAILFASGVFNFDSIKPQAETRFPNTTTAMNFCTKEENKAKGYDFKLLYDDEDAAPFIGGEEISEYVSGQWSCSMTDRTEENDDDAPIFDFIYMALNDDYENIEALKEVLAPLAEYQDVKKNTDEYFLSIARSTAPYIYLAAYKQAVVEIYADDEETAETVLRELNFPNYK